MLEYVADTEAHELTDALTGMPLIALFGGAAVFLLALVGVERRALSTVNGPRLIAGAVLPALIPAAWMLPALAALAVAGAVLIGLVAVEMRRLPAHEGVDPGGGMTGAGRVASTSHPAGASRTRRAGCDIEERGARCASRPGRRTGCSATPRLGAMSGTCPPGMSAAPPGPVSPVVMREVLGHFVSGIVVITAAGPEGPLGFTCQSFASLSLDPPLVSFAPARTSSTWPRIRDAGTFCINVLAADHQDVSAGFARSGVDKFDGVAWRPAPSGAPVLDGVSAWIDCSLWAEHDGGDHTIAVGRVLDLGADESRLPLLYYRGRYGVTAGPAS